MKNIIVTGANQNNLKNLSLSIPKNKITVFTGVSGSGKSSLVFETIGAEAQRQINETQNSFVRNRLQHYGIADVVKIENLNVPVIINQKRIGGNARSTVGTVTDIYAQLRLLFSRIGKPFVGYSNIFSFNNPAGMSPACEGLGTIQTINIDKLLDTSKSLNEGAINFPTFQPGGWRWTRYVHSGYFDNDKKLKDYTAREKDLLLYATEHRPPKPDRQWRKTVLYEGVIPRLEKAFLSRESKEVDRRKESIAGVITAGPCPSCKGERLNDTVLSCKIKGKNIADCCSLSVDELLAFVNHLDAGAYETITRELSNKLENMIAIGLKYLTLDRATATLSGGESQRIKMVKHLGNSLVDLLYIFDEPSIGLHPSDIDNIIHIIQKIRDKGNTILIVEHDPDIIRIADHVVDMGPLSGRHGGEIIYEGSFARLKASKGKTGAYFSSERTYNERPRAARTYLTITDANLHNLKNISVDIPREVLTVVTGVAGSGKSTLINQVLPQQHPDVKIIDQSLFAASVRSNLLTFLDIADDIRHLLADANHVKPNLFSSNSDGACPECKGIGVQKLDLAFMDDVEQICEVCNGSGFKPEVLKYRYNGASIADMLDMTVEEAMTFFSGFPFCRLLRGLDRLGLSYLSVGQRLASFSGGERQRLKLVRELDSAVQHIIVLDEPSTGLHPSDTDKILQVIDTLVDNGNTVIVIEHNLDIIAQADWIIDIGPGAGREGGHIVFEGTVGQLLDRKESATAKYLRRHLVVGKPA